jgi:hypothetical protein
MKVTETKRLKVEGEHFKLERFSDAGYIALDFEHRNVLFCPEDRLNELLEVIETMQREMSYE